MSAAPAVAGLPTGLAPSPAARARHAHWAAVWLAALTLGLAGCGGQGSSGKDTPAKAAASAASAGSGASAAAAGEAPVLLLAAEDLHTVAAGARATGPVITGALQPARKADLRAEVGAVVQQVLRDNGDAVRAGELLVQLDATSIRDSLASAEESVRASTQAFEQLERQVARLKTLQAQGMTSTQALEDAEVRRNNAQSDLVAARARVVAAQQQLRRTEVRAPFDGVVSERRASPGDTVQVGRELVKVIDPRSLRFEGLVSADRMHELKLGQPVGFRVNGVGSGAFAGRVRRIDAAANATTRQVEVVVEFADAAAAPRVAGLFAEGRVETGSEQALMLPENTLVGGAASAGQGQVWRLGAGRLARVSVKLGARDARSGQLPVLEGLAAGDRVLRNPSATLRDGQRFEMATAAAAAVAASAPAAKKPGTSGTPGTP